MKGKVFMEGKIFEEIFACRDCGNLDYANGKCKKCGSTNIEPARQDIKIERNMHDELMKIIYSQHQYFEQGNSKE